MTSLDLDSPDVVRRRTLRTSADRTRRRHLGPVTSWIAALLAGSAAFVAVVAVRAVGGLTGWRYLVVLALVMVIAPIGRNLSQRILFSIVALAGISPFMWWFSADLPYLDRGTVLLALAAAGLLGSVTYAAARRLSFRRFVPRFQAVDALPAVAGVASGWVVQNFLFAKSFESTLLLLTRSWDFAPHLNMFNMIRNHGSVIALLPSAPDGSAWSAASYPQGFHALLASLAEVVAGSKAGDIAQEAVLFFKLVGVAAVLGTLLIVAALTSLPVFRRHFLVTLPFVAVVATAWIVGPGAIPVFNAFPNFGLGVALCVACIAVVQLRRVVHPVAATTALVLILTAVAHGWILLLILCLPSVLVYGVYLVWHRREAGWHSLALHLAIAAVALAGVIGALWQLRKLSAGEVLTTPGGTATADTGVAVLCIVANAFVALAFYSRRKVGHADDRRGTLTSLHILATPLFAAVLLVGLAVFQLMEASKVTYYFHKSFLAVELMAIVCTVVGAAELWSPVLARQSRRKTFVAASLLTSLGATHFFGLPFTGLSEQGLEPTAQGAVGVLEQSKALSDPAPRLISKLAGMAALKNPRPFMYVGFDDAFDPQLAAQWSLTLQGRWTASTDLAVPMVKPLYRGPSHVPEAIDAVLTAAPDIDVVVDPELVPELRAWRPQFASRIITY